MGREEREREREREEVSEKRRTCTGECSANANGRLFDCFIVKTESRREGSK